MTRSSPFALSSRGLLREQDAVGREREIVDAVDSGQLAHEVREPGAQQRLAAREPQFRHAEPGGQPRDPRDFLEGQALGRLQELVALVIGLARHAVGAAEIAAVHDRDPQVVHRPAQPVARPHVARPGQYLRR